MENMREQNKPVRKKFNINGEIVEKMVKIYGINEFNEDGNRTHKKESFKEYWCEYSENGTLVCEHGTDMMVEYRREYDANGKLIYKKETTPFSTIETWHEYDKDGNKTHSKTSAGYEDWYEYNDGKLIHSNSSAAIEKWYEYDENGNKIYEKVARHRDIDCEDYEEWYEYDENGKETRWKTSNGYERCSKYDEKGNLIYSKNFNKEGVEEYEYEYDADGNCIHVKSSDGFESHKEYDEHGNMIHSKGTNGEEWHEYDGRGNIVYIKNPHGYDTLYEYEYWENGKVKKSIEYRSC